MMSDLKRAEALMRQLYIENVPDYSDMRASVELQPLSALHTGADVEHLSEIRRHSAAT